MGALSELYPGSIHVRERGLARGDDAVVWRLAIEEAFVLVSKDSDFRQMAFLLGPPPKVVWVALGNCTTDEVAALLRIRRMEIEAFVADPPSALLTLG